MTSANARRPFGRRNVTKRETPQLGRATRRNDAPTNGSTNAVSPLRAAPAVADAATYRWRKEGAAAAALLCGMLIFPVMEMNVSRWVGVAVYLGIFVFIKLAWHYHNKSQEIEMLELNRELHELDSSTVDQEILSQADPTSFAAWRHKQDAVVIAFASGVATVGSAVAYLGVGKLSFGMNEPVNVLPAITILSIVSLTVIVPVILVLVDYMKRRHIPRGLADVGIGIALTSIVWVPSLLLMPLDGANALLLALAMAAAGGVAGFQFWRYDGTIIR